MQRLHDLSREIYRLTAARYEAAIGPVMLPLARDLVMQRPLPDSAAVLDIGTGTGFVLRQAAGANRRCTGIDHAYPMLRAAASLCRRDRWPGVSLLQADAHNLACFPPATFDIALASFSLSECAPDRVLRSVRRVLRPGGLLMLQEWGPYDAGDPRAIVDDTLAAYIQPDADGLRARLRALLAEPLPWQMRLQDADDYQEILAEIGFAPLACSESRPVTLRLSVEDFLAYALAWAPRALEVAALSPGAHAAFRQAAVTRLGSETQAAQVLHFSPAVIRATASRL
ncbi:MAG: class I SAM-dependent methyltransferase [Anaerolineae bacterium]|nr:class I SAM-dependent methyltransferase [Anaerolineae bacterium]